MTPFFNFKANKFLPALMLEHAFPRRRRILAGRVATAGIALSLLPFGYALAIRIFALIPTASIASPALPWDTLTITYFFILIRFAVFQLTTFANSCASPSEGIIGSENYALRLNYYASDLWYRGIFRINGTQIYHLLSALPFSSFGVLFLARSGVAAKDFFEFLARPTALHDSPQIEDLLNELQRNLPQNSDITCADLLCSFFQLDGTFSQFITAQGVDLEIIRGAAEWAEAELAQDQARTKWWTRKSLGRIPGIAKSWAYGYTPLLKKFAADLAERASIEEQNIIGREREIKLLESALLKQAGANVMLIGEPGAGTHTILYGLIRMIRFGKVFPELEHKQAFTLFTSAIVAAGKTKGEIEALLLQILNEATRAGDIILVIEDFPEFVHSLANLGVSATEILTPYLSHSAIHIIGLAHNLNFRRFIENESALLEFFEKIELPEPEAENLMQILREITPLLEARHAFRVLLTYPAVQKIASGATQYLVNGALPKRAIDLAREVLQEADARKLSSAGQELVAELITRKTQMPLGKITDDEQKKLLDMELLLHQRVVGQDAAISAISDAIRRTRTGIQNPKRPIGTFLFLGPTGVGKTETAKTLAEVYFGKEDTMTRFDMTEYQTEDGIDRLIGSFERNEPGILSSKMRANPYGILLLDEFEKAHPKVKNLFLQILDEGFFSDYAGTRVNMRNTIIIATSNAGSQMIAEFSRENREAAKMEREIISYIEQQNILSPELLNRFDAIIIFRMLDMKTLYHISRLMLEKLAARLKKQNIILTITEPLINAVAKGGFDPAWGARPMQRFIQDKVEKIIADKIIRRDIIPGAPFSLSAEELQ